MSIKVNNKHNQLINDNRTDKKVKSSWHHVASLCGQTEAGTGLGNNLPHWTIILNTVLFYELQNKRKCFILIIIQ